MRAAVIVLGLSACVNPADEDWVAPDAATQADASQVAELDEDTREAIEALDPGGENCAARPPVATFFDDYLGHHGAEANPTGDLVGGGPGYSRAIPRAQATVVVESPAALEAALATAVAGDVVFLAPGDWDLTALARARAEAGNAEGLFAVPPGVTLASDRGAHLHVDEARWTAASGEVVEWWGSVFTVGNGARVTGLRLSGPYAGEDSTWPKATGIGGYGASDVEIDDNELWSWPGQAISFGYGAENSYVHHNWIHHNRRDGAGYGVVFGRGAWGRVIANLFDWNRHAIAADGRDTSYEAAWNMVLPHSNKWEQAFDMHGWVDRCIKHDCDEGARFAGTDAGGWVFIHHNTLLSNDGDGIWIRGVVAQCAWMTHNHFVHGRLRDIAVEALDVGSEYRAIYRAEGDRWVDSGDEMSLAAMNIQFENNRFEWEGLLFSSAAIRGWQPWSPGSMSLSQLRFGDFDGDGRGDVVRVTETAWTMRASATPAAGWVPMANRLWGLPVGSLAVGDFDGDGADDLFAKRNGRWLYAPRATGAWIELGASSVDFSELRFGDLDGDGKTDVFRSDDSQWWYSSGGATAWTKLAASSVDKDELRLGNFVGDARADVLRVADGRWTVSDAGLGPWQLLGTSSVGLSGLRLGDFDGDGTTDLFTSSDGRWKMSAGGRAPWADLGSSGHGLGDFAFTDMDGDGRTDVVYVGLP